MEPQYSYYRLESLGRAAIFVLPWPKAERVSEEVRAFLTEKFGGYTETLPGIFHGAWRNIATIHYDQHIRWEVAFAGKDRIDALCGFISYILQEIDEQCCYLSTGEDAWLVYPNQEPIPLPWKC